MTLLLRKWLAVAVLVGCAVLTGCGGEGDTGGKNSKILVVGSEASFPPMEFVDDNAQVVGFDIDLIRALAKEAGLEIEIKNVAWDGIFGALKSGNVDIIASSVTITEERKQQFDFTEPYLRAGQILLVRKGEKAKYPELASLNGKPVGVQMGTTGAEFMDKQGGYTVKQYNTAGLAMIDLANGNVEAVVIDKPVADYYATKKPEFAQKLEVVGEPQTEEQFGFVVRKGEKELLDKLNAALAKLRQDGTLQKIESQWFR